MSIENLPSLAFFVLFTALYLGAGFVYLNFVRRKVEAQVDSSDIYVPHEIEAMLMCLACGFMLMLWPVYLAYRKLRGGSNPGLPLNRDRSS